MSTVAVHVETDASLAPDEVNAAYGWAEWPPREPWRLEAVSGRCTWLAARDPDGSLVGIARGAAFRRMASRVPCVLHVSTAACSSRLPMRWPCSAGSTNRLHRFQKSLTSTTPTSSPPRTAVRCTALTGLASHQSTLAAVLATISECTGSSRVTASAITRAMKPLMAAAWASWAGAMTTSAITRPAASGG